MKGLSEYEEEGEEEIVMDAQASSSVDYNSYPHDLLITASSNDASLNKSNSYNSRSKSEQTISNHSSIHGDIFQQFLHELHMYQVIPNFVSCILCLFFVLSLQCKNLINLSLLQFLRKRRISPTAVTLPPFTTTLLPFTFQLQKVH